MSPCLLPTGKLPKSQSILNLHSQLLQLEMSKNINLSNISVHDINETLQQLVQQQQRQQNDNKENENIIKNNSSVKPIYQLPLQFNFHNNTFYFTNSQCNDNNYGILLKEFHTEFENYQESVYDRYGWHPDIATRIKIDNNAVLIGFIINNGNIKINEKNKKNVTQNNKNSISKIMGMISLFKYDDKRREIAFTVFPPFQRHHLATDLLRVCWELFANQETDQWIYVANCNKSSLFWRNFTQWYPEINLKLIYP